MVGASGNQFQQKTSCGTLSKIHSLVGSVATFEDDSSYGATDSLPHSSDSSFASCWQNVFKFDLKSRILPL